MKLDKLTIGYFIAALLEFFLIYLGVRMANPYDNDRIEIYVVYHKPSRLYKNEVLIPIQAGRALNHTDSEFFNQMIGDDTGDNISVMNDRYSELTVLYWIWKNSTARYVGLMHYRRFLNLASPHSLASPENYFGLTRQNILKRMENIDILTDRYVGLNTGRNVYEHYARNHYIEDLYMIISYIRHHYPEMENELNEFLLGPYYVPTNMFIARKEVIDAYCEWLFDVLFAVDDDMNIQHGLYDPSPRYSDTSYKYQKRAPAFIAERLFSFWLMYNKDKYKHELTMKEYYEEEYKK